MFAEIAFQLQMIESFNQQKKKWMFQFKTQAACEIDELFPAGLGQSIIRLDQITTDSFAMMNFLGN